MKTLAVQFWHLLLDLKVQVEATIVSNRRTPSLSLMFHIMLRCTQSMARASKIEVAATIASRRYASRFGGGNLLHVADDELDLEVTMHDLRSMAGAFVIKNIYFLFLSNQIFI